MSNSPKPVTFYLNEAHELVSLEKDGGGRKANYAPIDWIAKSKNLEQSFLNTTDPSPTSRDPLKDKHHFVIAVPAAYIEKLSNSEKAKKQGGIIRESPSFGGGTSRVFRKLGMDLLETLPDGRATIHIPASRKKQIVSSIGALSGMGATSRDRSRWINFDAFERIPWQARISPNWLNSFRDAAVTMFIRFHALISRLEVQEILNVLAKLIDPKRERLVSAGRDFGGRYWCRAEMIQKSVVLISNEFDSVHSVHPPITIAIAASKQRRSTSIAPAPARPTTHVPVELPTVAVVDTGIPNNHVILGDYVRPGYMDPALDPSARDFVHHGSMVASRVVFGDLDMNEDLKEVPPGRCRVLDVMIPADDRSINIEMLNTAIDAVVATAPDVRVFNLSFDGPPLNLLNEIDARERLLKLQDLDNLAFARDILPVISAGNVMRGVVPLQEYPRHLDDPRWELGPFARSFNGIVCGSYVNKLSANAIATHLEAPSPFTRIGPGLCESPVPGFGAPGGNTSANDDNEISTGVWVCTGDGIWQNRVGTSFAAPLLAAEAAIAFRELSRFCPPGTRPFAATVKAYLNLVAARRPLPGAFEKLAERTIGKGFARAESLRTPDPNTGVFVWQTILQAANSVGRVQFPVPLVWLTSAKAPNLRIVVAWETPVNHSLVEFWGCRKVSMRVRPFGASGALVGRGRASKAYPLLDRSYDLNVDGLREKGYTPSDESWVVEVEYEEVGDYPPAMTFSAQQRVGLVIELSDSDPVPLSPQQAIQAIPAVGQMVRLSVLQQPISVPVRLGP